MIEINQFRSLKRIGHQGIGQEPPPDHWLISNGGKPLTANTGENLVTEIIGVNEMLLTDYRPYRDDMFTTQIDTQVVADDAVVPTNWVSVRSVSFANMPAKRYKVELNFSWFIDGIQGVDDYALFRATINGNAGSFVSLRTEVNLEADIEHWMDSTDLPSGDITIELQMLKAFGSSATPVLSVDRIALTLLAVAD